MNMAGLAISQQQLSSLGRSCGRTATDLRNQHAALSRQLAPLVGLDWPVPVRSQLAEFYEQLATGMQAVTDALDGTAALLSQPGRGRAPARQPTGCRP